MILLAILCAACTPAPLPEPVAMISPCSATDGDTIRCGDERVRLLGIDAPERGLCREGRTCVEGDPIAATDSLASAIEGGDIAIVRMGKDRYGRTLALVKSSGMDLSCRQLVAGHAVYKRTWDNSLAVARTCPDYTR